MLYEHTAKLDATLASRSACSIMQYSCIQQRAPQVYAAERRKFLCCSPDVLCKLLHSPLSVTTCTIRHSYHLVLQAIRITQIYHVQWQLLSTIWTPGGGPWQQTQPSSPFSLYLTFTILLHILPLCSCSHLDLLLSSNPSSSIFCSLYLMSSHFQTCTPCTGIDFTWIASGIV